MTDRRDRGGNLLSQELVERIATLRIKAQRAALGLRSGIHESPHRGASVIFAEHREYRPGDDLRLLDWRAFARSDRYIIKHFEQETHLRAHLLLDVSASMNFDGGEPAAHKREYAATLLAALAFILLGQGDAVGLLTLAASVQSAVPARAHPGQLDALLERLADDGAPVPATDLRAALEAASERVGRRGLVALASDLLDTSPHALDPLTRLRSLGHDVLVFQVLHPQELELRYRDRTRFIDPETGETLDSDPDAVRTEYLDELHAFIEHCRRRCTAAGARYVLARSDAPVQEVIAEALAMKRGRAWA